MLTFSWAPEGLWVTKDKCAFDIHLFCLVVSIPLANLFLHFSVCSEMIQKSASLTTRLCVI